MLTIKALIDDAQALYESFSEDEQKRAAESLAIMQSYRDESKILDLVCDITKVRLIKNVK